MKFEEVLPALREGKKITNSIIKNKGYEYLYYFNKTIFCGGGGGYWTLTDREIVDIDDWEIVKEPKKVKVKLRDLTEEQLEKWKKTNCKLKDCEECIFKTTICFGRNASWVNNKDLYSDKFLDQEVEIYE